MTRFIDPRFPPVELLSPLEPVDAPQFIPGSPHNLPARRDQMPRRVFQSGVGPMEPYGPGSVPGVIIGGGVPPSGGPLAGEDAIAIYDPWHSAMIIEGNITPTIVSVRFLEQMANKRNFLMLRNGATTASLRISFGRDASAASPLVLAPGGIVLLDVVVPQDDVYCQLTVADATAALAFAYSTIAA